MKKNVAIVLSAGTGRRMGSDIPKQYLPLYGKPVLYYSLKAFEESGIDEVVLVTGADDIDFCRTEIVKAYGFRKITRIVPGGKERYDSVFEGLKAVKDAGYVLIHDGARPLLTPDIISRSIDCVKKECACVVGMPVKDTIKIMDEHAYAAATPDRSSLWMVQTPQSFSYELIWRTYELLQNRPDREAVLQNVTDDAMLVERMTGTKAKLIEGSYENMKITTPEDLLVAEVFLKKLKKIG